MGTPDYIAPEQARGAEVDARADMYALGCSLFELFVGRTPFPGLAPQAAVASRITEPPPPPRAVNPAVGAVANNLVLRLLAKEPAGRFSGYAALLDACDAALAAPGALPPNRPPPRRTWRCAL